MAVGGSAAAVTGRSGMLPDDTTVLAEEPAGLASSIAAATGTLAAAGAGEQGQLINEFMQGCASSRLHVSRCTAAVMNG